MKKQSGLVLLMIGLVLAIASTQAVDKDRASRTASIVVGLPGPASARGTRVPGQALVLVEFFAGY